MGKFIPNPAFDLELFMQAQIEKGISDAGRRILSNAKSIASGVGHGNKAADISGGFKRTSKGRPHYYVQMDDGDKEGSAVAIEFGTSDTPVHAILRRAIEAAR